MDFVVSFSLRSYLLSARSKEERDTWIEAIVNAIPSSPRMKKVKKEQKSDSRTEPKTEPKTEPTKSKSEKSATAEEIPHPTSPTRQDTAVDAAVAVASCTDNAQEQREVEEVCVWGGGGGIGLPNNSSLCACVL